MVSHSTEAMGILLFYADYFLTVQAFSNVLFYEYSVIRLLYFITLCICVPIYHILLGYIVTYFITVVTKMSEKQTDLLKQTSHR